MQLSDGNLLFLLLSLLLSVLFAGLMVYFFEQVVAKVKIHKIIGSSANDKMMMNIAVSIIDMVSFNNDEVRKKLISAGFYNDFIMKSYYLFKFVPFVIAFSVLTIYLLLGQVELDMYVVYISVATIAFLLGPDIFVAQRAKKITKRVSGKLPFLLDLMNVCVHTGMTIEASLEHLAHEIASVDENLAYVVKTTMERAKIIGIEKAIDEFYLLVPTSEAQSFSMTLSQSLQYGSSVGPMLSSLASDIRELNMMDLEEKIGKLGAKMSIPLIVFIMVPIVVLIAAPGIMRMFANA